MNNYHAIHITYHGPTSHKPARLKAKSLRFPNNYLWISRGDSNHWEEEAIRRLEEEGYKIVGIAEYHGNGFILVTETFKQFKEDDE